MSWFAMLFAAGMGIGLVFFGAAEPLTFYADTGATGIPPNATALPDPDRAERALGQTFLHWGLHAWAIYVVVCLAVAYAVHRKGRPLSIRWALAPLLGKRADTWIGGWTTFYWGWWISWSPFVGVFIARISKGRTVREFILGVLLVPTVVTFLWFTIMGGTALYEAVVDGIDFTGGTGTIDANTALFDTFAQLPAGALMSGIAVVLVSIFFITSADSGAFVMDMIAHKGDPNPPRLTRVFWATASGVIAASLIWVSSLSGDENASGMTALQSLALLSALPFSLVMIGMCISLWRSLSIEVKVIERLELRLRQREFVERYSTELAEEVSGRLEGRVAEQVEVQVAEHLSTFTGEIPSVSGEDGGRRRPRNPFRRNR